MAFEPKIKTETPTPVKEKWFEVRLSRDWRVPTLKGKNKSGVLYQRGGYQFTSEKDHVRVPESELKKFKIAVSPRFATGATTYEFDGNLVIEEVDGP